MARRIKQAILARTLDVRRLHQDVFSEGSYEPVHVEGAMSCHVVSFIRHHGHTEVLVVAPRLPFRLMCQTGIAVDSSIWIDTVLRWTPRLSQSGLPLAAVCSVIPVALLCTRPS